MTLLKQLALSAVGLVLTVTPSLAAVEASTRDLLNHLDDNGVKLAFNTDECDGTFYGSYQFNGLKRLMLLCPGDTVTDIDHNTVRHETMHALQHCVNVSRGTPPTHSIMDPEKLVKYAEEILPESEIEHILGTYPKEHWLVELEASTAAIVFNAGELIELFNMYCVAE